MLFENFVLHHIRCVEALYKNQQTFTCYLLFGRARCVTLWLVQLCVFWRSGLSHVGFSAADLAFRVSRFCQYIRDCGRIVISELPSSQKVSCKHLQ